MLIRVKGLELRGGVWKYRRMVPQRLRAFIKSHQVIRSLETDDRVVALRRLPAKKAEVDRIFAEADAALKNPAVREYKAREAIRASVAKALQEDAEDRLMRPRVESQPPDEDENVGTAGDGEAEYMALTSALEKLDKADGEDAETQRTILVALLKKLNGQTPEATTEESPPLSIVFDCWRAERQPPAKTWEEWNTARKSFEAVVGADLPVRSIAKHHVRAFKDALLKMPARRLFLKDSDELIQHGGRYPKLLFSVARRTVGIGCC